MEERTFDVVVLGGGPGGYPCAIRLGQLGLEVACVEGEEYGGVCLNWGCIPSKALISTAHQYEKAGKAGEQGLSFGTIALDVGKLQSWKNGIVKKLTGGVRMLLKQNGAEAIEGMGRFVDGKTLEVTRPGGEKLRVRARRAIVVATGSATIQIPGFELDGKQLIGAREAVSLPEVPKRLGVVGAGVIGLEMGSVWRRLGAEVTILEALPSFLAAADEQVAKEAFRVFNGPLDLKIYTGAKITAVKPGRKSVAVTYTDREGNTQNAEFDKLIVAIGRVPNTAGLNGEAIGLQLDERGYVAVDASNRTSVPNVYAIGDVVRGPMLAHKSSEEGVAAAETIAGEVSHVNFDTIPWVIYTSPEIAWVGKTEQQLKADAVPYRAGQFPFIASGRARALGETAGFVKMLAHAETDRILGVHAIGPYASELIAEAVVAMEFGASAEDIARIVHAHPTLSEALHEAALGVHKRTLNI